MSLLSVAPDIVSAASGNLENLGAALRNATTEATSRTMAVAAPAADEVSAAITALLSNQAQEFQAVSANAAAFHDEFVKLLSGGVAQYVAAEAANVQQMLATAVNTPAQTLLGHPIVGTGQGLAAAAEYPTPQTISQIIPIAGPFELFVEAAYYPTATGGLAVNTNIGIRLNTPLAPLVLFSEGGGAILYPDTNAYIATGHFSVPFFYYGNAALYTPPSPVPAWTTYTVNGVEVAMPLNGLPSVSISWLGTPFEGILPRIGYSPAP